MTLEMDSPPDVQISGPWVPIKCSKPQAGGDWFIARQILGDPACSHFEQIRDVNGLLIRYESEVKARRAVAEANGTSWFATDEEAELEISWANGEIQKDGPK